jgi:23S rRNA U2552 (ribose-2'-O)-methylase RlmE/FtsJ
MNFYTLPKTNNFIDAIEITTKVLEATDSSDKKSSMISPSLNNVSKVSDDTDCRSIYDSTDDTTHISKTLCAYLKTIKKQIDNNMELWDNMKKFTNPYEFIHTVIPGCKVATSQLKPLSRSFYKMIEISHTMELFKDSSRRSVKTFHLAEGPGGFIEATRHIRTSSLKHELYVQSTIPHPPGLSPEKPVEEIIKDIYKNDRHYGMTLINDNDANIPGWGKSKGFLKKNPNVIIEKGVTGTGDLLCPENLVYYYENFNNSMDIVTGDGGFDFSIDFNHQELLASKLLFAQISFALAIQKEQGHFVLKVFDLFTRSSIECLYLLSSLYEEVHIIKPNTSRLANSEKYIVCKYFHRNEKYTKLMSSIIKNYPLLQTDSSNTKSNSLLGKEKEETENSKEINTGEVDHNHNHSILHHFLPFPIEYYFVNKIEDYNAIFGQQQIENITTTMSNISSKAKADKIDNLKKNNIMKCISWCEKHNIPSNNSIISNSLSSKSQKKHNNSHHHHNGHASNKIKW